MDDMVERVARVIARGIGVPGGPSLDALESVGVAFRPRIEAAAREVLRALQPDMVRITRERDAALRRAEAAEQQLERLRKMFERCASTTEEEFAQFCIAARAALNERSG